MHPVRYSFFLGREKFVAWSIHDDLHTHILYRTCSAHPTYWADRMISALHLLHMGKRFSPAYRASDGYRSAGAPDYHIISQSGPFPLRSNFQHSNHRTAVLHQADLTCGTVPQPLNGFRASIPIHAAIHVLRTHNLIFQNLPLRSSVFFFSLRGEGAEKPSSMDGMGMAG